MAHNFSDLLESYGGKTYFIGHNPVSYIHDRCTTVCFDDETTRLAAIGSVPVFKGVSLRWASLSLTCCAKCEHFGYVSDMCSVGGFSGSCGRKMASVHDQVCLANIYKKRHASVACPVFFGGKSWAQVASLAAPFGTGAQPVSGPGALVSGAPSAVFEIVHRLNGVDLVSLVSVSPVVSSVISASSVVLSVQDMALDPLFSSSHFSSSVSVLENIVSDLSLCSSKVLTFKVGRLESKLMALDVAVGSILAKLDQLGTDLGSPQHSPSQ
ncbi:hypothetical protein G9A89_022371 [Geosiphon pyriformis]|nr:hypothetical protein G9A89_022371 [Geosiphon pyriformis]